MSRINEVKPEQAQKEVKDIYKSLEQKMGRVPNIFLNMGNSAAVLKGYLGLSDAVGQTSLPPKLREEIALIVSQANNCRYCLSAHSAIAKGLGVPDQEVLLARQGQAKDPKTQAILKFAKSVVENRGNVSNQDVASLKAAGVTDQQVVEIILIIALNMFTNYFNHITDPKIDFPVAPELS